MINLYRLNTGSCGGCDVEIDVAVASDAGLAWANSPQQADVLLLTGPITAGSRDAVRDLLRQLGNRPLLAIGRCAIDGHPFGKGGVKELPDLQVALKLDGCPPTPEEIVAVIREALGRFQRGD